MAVVVVSHEYDSAAGLYRLTIGHEVWSRMVVEVEDGTFEEKDVKTGHELVEDFVFSDQDERWKGKDLEEIVLEQRGLVSEALGARKTQRRHAKMPTSLPGEGEEL